MTFIIWSAIKPVLEIIILWIVFYRILFFFEGTRAFHVLKGITYLLVAFLVCQLLGLDTLNWLLTKFFAISIIALLIIFQQELRQGLARLGQQHLFSIDLEEAEVIAIIDEIVAAVYKLIRKKTGCLIAVERETKLKTYIESGVQIDSKVSAELIISMFAPTSPLHDGGIIVRGERIVAASCLFPLSENPMFDKTTGTRHRAALGISEQTDAIVIMVSEETAQVSLANEGRFITVDNKEHLGNLLKDILIKKATKKK